MSHNVRDWMERVEYDEIIDDLVISLHADDRDAATRYAENYAMATGYTLNGYDLDCLARFWALPWERQQRTDARAATTDRQAQRLAEQGNVTQ